MLKKPENKPLLFKKWLIAQWLKERTSKEVRERKTVKVILIEFFALDRLKPQQIKIKRPGEW